MSCVIPRERNPQPPINLRIYALSNDALRLQGANGRIIGNDARGSGRALI